MEKKYLKFCFTYKGRLNRKAFALYSFGMLCGILCLHFLLYIPFVWGPLGNYEYPIAIAVIGVIFWASPVFVTIIGIVGCYFKRCHDLNFSGWWLVLLTILSNAMEKLLDEDGNSVFPDLLPNQVAWGLVLVFRLLSVLCWIVLFFVKGTKGPNKYGPDPLESS